MTCGSVLTKDTPLRADLTCTGDGLIVGADGVTVDLGGHQLRGSGTGSGIQVNQHANVQVRHGTIAGFARQALLNNASDVTLTKLTVSGATGLDVRDGVDVRFEAGTLSGTEVIGEFGLRLSISRSVVRDTSLVYIDATAPAITDSVLTDSFVGLSEVGVAVVEDSTLVRSPLLIP